MFASRTQIEAVIRVLLIAVISFNAAVPTRALDNSSSAISPETTQNNLITNTESVQADLMENFDQLPIAFVPNVGQQEDETVRYEAQALGGQLFFSTEEVVFSLFNPVDIAQQKPEERQELRYDHHKGSVLRIQFQGANSFPDLTGTELLPGVVNYLKGTDPAQWLTNVPTYSGVSYQELYPGIELRYEGLDGILKSTFYVAPGADPSGIVWKYKGADNVELDISGNLVITLPAAQQGETGTVLTESAPVAWQEVNGNRVLVAVQYQLKNNGKASFLLPNGYDPSLPLIIDPELTASTYLGGSRTDEGEAITVDADGNIYVTGSTASTNYPTVYPIQTNRPSTDVFITKLDPVARTILYSTYLGGNEPERGLGIRLDSQGRITLVGETESSDFPTLNGYSSTFGGGTCGTDPCDDVFVAQLAPNGSALRYSTYLGSSGQDEGIGITLDSTDQIYITGVAGASGFPIINGYDASYGGGTCSGAPCPDAFIAKLDPAATGTASLLYSTYLGSNDHDRGKGIALDANGYVYVAGYTNSDGFPVRSAYQSTRVRHSDIFVSKFDLSANGDASLLYSTYFGGDESDHAYGIAVRGEDQVYLTGYTQSSNFPGASNTFGGGTCGSVSCFDAYALHLDISNNTVIYNTYLGGSDDDRGNGIALDADGNAYVTGSTKSINFPLANEIQPLKGGDSCGTPPCADAFAVKLNASGNAIIYSTYLGGDGEDYGNAITVDALGGAYITGYTFSTNFPTTNGSGLSSSTYSDAFVLKIFDAPPPTPTPTVTVTTTPAATDTPTPTPTKLPPAGLSCVDWREGLSHGWTQSPWTDTEVQVLWNSNGMYASASTNGTYQAGAYLQMPAGGPHKVLFQGAILDEIAVAQGSNAPTTSGPLSDILTANPDGSYLVTAAFLEVKWYINTPVELGTASVFRSFCTSPVTLITTPTSTDQPPTTSDLIVQSVGVTSITFDGQTLVATGMASAEIGNIGLGSTNGAFVLAFFEDHNGNQAYEAGVDNLLGSAVQNTLASSATITVSVPISGTLMFRDNLIYALVDAENNIIETDETNNVNYSVGSCEFVPSTTPFSPTLEWQWTGGTTLPTFNQVMMAPVVADMNQDGIPEIIFSSFAGGAYTSNSHLRAISGRDGAEVFTVTDTAYNVWGVGNIATGDIDSDSRYEIIAVDESGNRLIAFEHDGTFKWRSPSILGGIDRGGPAIADITGDTIPEIIIGSTVLNSNGIVMWAGTYGKGNNHNGPLSLVADLDLDGHPEVVAGNTAYRSDGNLYWQNASLTDGFNAVANFDEDPFPEVVLVDASRVYLLEHDGTVKWGPIALPGGGNGGAPTIADVDGDGEPEIGVAGASRYVVFETNGTVKWSSITQDGSSHTTGSSVFDFEADGSAEIIYRDEVVLRVYRGEDGTVLWQTPNTSGTTYELPVIADVDADGNAEIVMVSNNYNRSGGTTGVQIYGDSTDQWVSTRQLWNQHTYHITNVYDNGTIPTVEINNWDVYNNYRLNTLTVGCVYAKPDLTASYVRKTVNPTDIALTVRIGNGGSVVADANVPVSFYNGNPATGGVLLGVTNTSISLHPGTYEDITLTLPTGTLASPIWVVADDNGSGNGVHTELNENNNAYDSHVYLTLTPNQQPVVDAGPDQQLTLSDPSISISISGAASDDGLPINQLTYFWTATSGLGNVAFANPSALTTTVSFDQGGAYVLRLTATDGELSTYDELTVIVTAPPTPTFTPVATPTVPPLSEMVIPGWIASPVHQSTVSGVVPITLVEGVTLQSGIVDFWPVNDLTQVKVLATIPSGGGQGMPALQAGQALAYLDTTTLANGSYVIRLQGTDINGVQQDSGVMITVAGEYKPGRVRFTITDLTIPVVGLPITIARTYDSLERNQVGDFGYGWSLDIGNPKLETNPAHDVTITMPDGRRSTFYFTPRSYGGVFSFFMYPDYTPEAGVYGKLSSNGCDMLVLSGGQYYCFLEGDYQPTEYTYTDPYGRKFVMDADGTLKTITDLNNNVLTFSPNGITSSAGNLNVPFERDAQGRITKVTYPAGKEYLYNYQNDTGADTGELRTVTFPSVTLPNNTQQNIILRYDYFADHSFKEARDPRGYTPVITTYDSAGRIDTVTDAAGNLTTYSYDLETHTTTIHYLGDPANPGDDLGDAILTYNAAGDLVSYTNTAEETTLYEYDPNTRKLIKVQDPLTHETRYTYNTDGHPTSIIDPLNHTLGTVAYNQYGGPTAMTTAQGSNATISYDPVTFMPTSASDNLGALGGYTWTSQGNPDTYTDQYGEITDYEYTPQGYVETKTDPLGHVTRFTYDLFGRVTNMTIAYNTPDAMTTHYVYDELGRLTEATSAFGTSRAATTKYEYDANGNRTAVVDPLGRRTEYEYDNANRLILVTFAAHAPSESTYTKYDYDIYGRLMDVTVGWNSPEASRTHYVYDDAGRQTDVTIAFGTTSASTTHYVYYADGRVKDVTVAYNTVDASTTHYAYDAAGRTTNVTTAAGTADASTTHYEYYDSGLLRSMTTAYGTNVAATTTYIYDSRGRLTTTQHPDGTTTLQFYDPLPGTPGWKDSTVDAAGVLTSYLYDPAGRLDQLITSATDVQTGQTFQQITNYEYDAADRLTDTFDPLNQRTSFTYSPSGQMETSTSWLNATTPYITTYNYNLAGEQTSVEDANGHLTQYVYDERGLLKRTIHPPTPEDTGLVTTSQTYDALGRLLTSTDENGIVTRSTYNAAGQLIAVTLADGTPDETTIQYGYNRAGQLTSITDDKDHVTSFQYNKAGQQVRKILPDNVTYEQFGYNAAGNMTSHRLEDGNTNTFRYDRMNRLTDIVYFDGRSITFEYTNGGQRKKASVYPQPLSVPQVYNYSYDPFQRLKQVTYPDGRAVSYTYYDNDLRHTMTTPAGTVTYGYDGLDRLTSVLAGTSETTYEYNPVGFMTDAFLPNGVHTQYTPNARDQLKSVISKNSSNTTLLSFAYELDKAGNRKKVTEMGGSSVIWNYDNLYRLKDEIRRDGSNTITWQAGFTYDAAGNRESMTVNGVTTSYQYNALDQLTSAGAVTYGYDGRGNLNKVTNGSQVTNYTYNAADQLAGVSLPGGTNISYAYDGDGRRVKQTVGTAITNYLWDEASAYGDVVLETNNAGATTASYVLGGTGLISQTRSGATSYFLQDGQGSTRALTNGAGAVTDTYSYTAFGDSFSRTGTTTNPYQYTGQQFDSLTGLYSLRARYYAPGLGRFLSQDTYPVNFNNPVELNRYIYTANNPINRMDPTGYNSTSENAMILGWLPTIGRPALTRAALVTGAVVLGIVIGLVMGEVVDAPPDTDTSTEVQEFELAAQIAWLMGGRPKPPNNKGVGWAIAAFLAWLLTQAILSPGSGSAQPSPQPTEEDPFSKKVLIVGDGDFSYTRSLAVLHPDWNIIGTTYGDGSNNQTVIGTTGNATLVNNVDAKRLESGAITRTHRYDAIIFNNPYAGTRGKQTASLISSFIRSGQRLLTPYGQIHINVTKQLLLDFSDVAETLGLPNNTSATINNLPTFGQTQYFAPYTPRYSDGNIMLYYGEDPSRVASLKNFVFP